MSLLGNFAKYLRYREFKKKCAQLTPGKFSAHFHLSFFQKGAKKYFSSI